MATEFDSKKWGAFMAIPFGHADATTGEADTDMTAGGGQSTLFVAPGPGSVVGISANCAAITAGTITLEAHKAGTEFTEAGAPVATLSSTADTNGTYATVEPGALRFDAGDTLGLSITTTTTLDPTNTLDVEAVLFIQLDA